MQENLQDISIKKFYKTIFNYFCQKIIIFVEYQSFWAVFKQISLRLIKLGIKLITSKNLNLYNIILVMKLIILVEK